MIDGNSCLLFCNTPHPSNHRYSIDAATNHSYPGILIFCPDNGLCSGGGRIVAFAPTGLVLPEAVLYL